MSREEIRALLPFVANDSLTGPERDAAEAAIDADPDLQSELRALRGIRTAMQAEAPVHSPGEIGLARLMREVEADKARAPARRRPWIWQAAAAVFAAVALGQAALHLPGTAEMGVLDGFRLTSGRAAPDADFTIAVLPQTTEGALRDLLLRAGVEIVSGPSALGLYRLAPIDDVTRDAAYDILSGSDLLESVSSTD